MALTPKVQKEFAGFDMEQVMPKLGYTGPNQIDDIRKFLTANPNAARKLDKWGTMASKMIRGEAVDTVFRSQVSTPNLVGENKPPQQAPSQVKTAINNPSQQPRVQMKKGGSVKKDGNSDFKLNPDIYDKDGNVKGNVDIKPFSQETTTPTTGQTPAMQKTAEIMADPFAAVGSDVKIKPDLVTDEQVKEGEIATGTGQLKDRATGDTVNVVDNVVEATVPEALADISVHKAQDDIDKKAAVEKPVGVVSEEAQVDPAQLPPDKLAQLDLKAPQLGEAQKVIAPDKRVVEGGELIEGVADAAKASKFVEGVEAATGAPSSAATVKGQLTSLMEDFEGSEPPAWAAGGMRQAVAALAKRGMSASSLAGQAIVQAAMESAMPIAMADAQTTAQFESMNLSNRQQMAMLRAEKRAQFMGQEFDQAFQARVQNAAKISDIANMNFSAEQTIALENARMAQTVDLTNLSNQQAKLMADVAAMTQVDLTNLNNRQQAAVQNAKSFLEMDMSNLEIDQQAAMFEAQSRVQALFTDVAAENAAEQFDQETSKFFASLEAQTSQYNAGQANAIAQYNAGQENTMLQFYENLDNNREQFNAENQLEIASSNAKWRQSITTQNNAITNASNQINAQTALGLTNTAYANMWQRDRDILDFTFSTAKAAKQQQYTLTNLAVAEDIAAAKAAAEASGGFWGSILDAGLKILVSKATGGTVST
tara:strand:+ start:629 stop:2752 length:2124 start_codon:yes stop_codon:yes gene_type:complete